jgi:hypothetical protein
MCASREGQYIARNGRRRGGVPRVSNGRFLEEHRDIDLLETGVLIFKGEGKVIGRYPTVSSYEAISAGHGGNFRLPILLFWRVYGEPTLEKFSIGSGVSCASLPIGLRRNGRL